MTKPQMTGTGTIEIPFGLFELTNDWIIRKYDPDPTVTTPVNGVFAFLGQSFLTDQVTRVFVLSCYGRLEGFRNSLNPADSFYCSVPVGGGLNQLKVRLARLSHDSGTTSDAHILLQISET